MKSHKILSTLLLSVLLFTMTGCKDSPNTKELKQLCLSYQQLCTDLICFFNEDFQLNKETAEYILQYTEDFNDSIITYKKNIASMYYNRLSEGDQVFINLANATNNVNLILHNIINNPNSITKETYTEFTKNFNRIHTEMISLEYDRILTSEEIISDYIKYFMIFIIFFLVLCGVLLIIFIIEIKQREIKLIETTNFLEYTIKGQEEEKQRIARELHDTVAQDIRYIIQLIKKVDSTKLQKDILTREENCLKQVRNICSAFVPQDIENKDLIASLNEIILTIKSQSNIDIKLTILDEINFKNMEGDSFLHFYRIIQEILNNAQKHSQASEISILIKRETTEDGNFIHLIITDDGIGIDKQILDSIKEQKITLVKKHFGLKNIIQRVKLLNGNIEFTSDQDFGTEISVIIPE